MEKMPGPITYVERNGLEKNIDEIMDSVKRDLAIIIEKMRDSIDNHTYGSIVGIDGGGRIPALTLGRTINSIYSHKNQDKIETFFIAGARSFQDNKNAKNKEAALKTFFNKEIFKKIKANNEKVLIVEDVIASGDSLKLIVKTMKELGIPYEIATLSFSDSDIIRPTYNADIDIVQLEDKLDSNILYGEYGSISDLYGCRQMSGVHKKPDELFSKPIGKLFPDYEVYTNVPSIDGPIEKDSQNYEVLKHTRELISKISKELFEEYMKKD